MTRIAPATITASQMLAEAQGYRTSLESLLELGRTILLQPSMEDSSASAYKILTEGVLESADHQADLTAVEGVTEPAAVVELIMQDILTPRLTGIEEIEQSLQAKVDANEVVPFTTRDAETTSSMESVHHRAEVLDLFKEHVGDVKVMIASMENMSVDTIRPMVLRLMARAGEGVAALGISMEGIGQTQVLGEMADAVDRIETLVNKAHEEAVGISDAARAESEGVGAGGEDKMGDVLDAHREELPVGPQLADGVSAATVENDSPAPTDSSDITGTEDDDSEAIGDDVDTGAAADDGEPGLELEAVGSEEADDDTDASVDVEAEAEEAAVDDVAAAEGEDDTAVDGLDEIPDAADVAAVDDVVPDTTDDVDLDTEADAAEGSDDEEEEKDGKDDGKDDDEEEEEDSTASTESLSEAIVIDDLKLTPETTVARRDAVTSLLDTCSSLNLLSEKGSAALTGGVGEDFVLENDMFLPATADVLVRHYDTWVNAAVRDGSANTRALMALVEG
jgi:hypothetical protein